MPETWEEWETLITVTNPVFTILTGVFAYYFARSHNRKDATTDLIHQAARNACMLWMSCPKSVDNQQRAKEMQADLTLIALKVSKRKKNRQKFKDNMILFRQATTGDDFCKKTRQILPNNHTRLEQIKSAAEKLCEVI